MSVFISAQICLLLFFWELIVTEMCVKRDTSSQIICRTVKDGKGFL